ncbi:MAG: hypothetical protein NTV97_28780 [Alphaproteobacteria bacterium]|nr:hypothetical protein [Alphaproteobacteria bacterium]
MLTLRSAPAAPADAAPAEREAVSPAEEAFVRAELIRRLFDGSRQSRYFSFVLWPVIAAIYWRQVDLLELLGPFLLYIVVTLGFDLLRRNFARAQPSDEAELQWGWWFAALSGCCWPPSPPRCRSAPPIRRPSIPSRWPPPRRCCSCC